jgi:cyclopropane-fatty-acyl-phospholipid synthase
VRAAPLRLPRHEPLTSFGSSIFRWIAERLLEPADVRIDGNRPWDIRVHDTRAFRRGLVEGSIGLGEAYLDGWWSCEDLEELACRIALARLEEVSERLPTGLALRVSSALGNRQSPRRATRVARAHYDLGNDLFLAFLGRIKSYSCGYFAGTDDLAEAQERKLDLVCQKLGLRAGEHLLDVGGGWGELARHAASRYGVRVTSINISAEQMRFAREHCRGLDVEIVRCDYRNLRGTFDKIAAVAMFTHVGHRNYRTFMETMHRALKPSGVLVMEGIWGNVSMTCIDPWMDKYIFPNAMLPSGAQTFAAFEGLFVAEDLHNFGPDYVKTLRMWNDNLQRAWPELRARYDERVRKIFEYYFLMNAGYFRARTVQNWQLVLTPQGTPQPQCRVT